MPEMVYKIVECTRLLDVPDHVNAALSAGWELYGNVITYPDTNGIQCFSQPLIKRLKKRKEKRLD